jgi:hypothetical protein
MHQRRVQPSKVMIVQDCVPQLQTQASASFWPGASARFAEALRRLQPSCRVEQGCRMVRWLVRDQKRPPARRRERVLYHKHRSIAIERARRAPHRSHASIFPSRLHHRRQVVPARVDRACVWFCLLWPRAHSDLTTPHATTNSHRTRFPTFPTPPRCSITTTTLLCIIRPCMESQHALPVVAC